MDVSFSISLAKPDADDLAWKIIDFHRTTLARLDDPSLDPRNFILVPTVPLRQLAHKSIVHNQQ